MVQLNSIELYLANSPMIRYIFFGLTSLFAIIAISVLVLICVKMYLELSVFLL
jgi:hypothetical protein